MNADVRKRSMSVALVLTAILALVVPAAAGVGEIPPGPETDLPDYIGQPAVAKPLPNLGVPQNPNLAPDPFSIAHSDIWMSDAADLPGPLGRDPVGKPATTRSSAGRARPSL